ncbi:hypothetical protein BofuT4_P132850.1 [Botrytis cinerea T4]|uniref:Uncharacterized protein n=1 Tax=Botryotinia fuckeliana (strain T4) TaxID=999810 RepID=G2YQ33_BOTF4|nr:hypothetical protein BofuT4_P132850.1 [Botrytis cinerea T4]
MTVEYIVINNHQILNMQCTKSQPDHSRRRCCEGQESREIPSAISAKKSVEDKGGVIDQESNWGFFVKFSDTSVSTSSITEHPHVKTIELGSNEVTTQ